MPVEYVDIGANLTHRSFRKDLHAVMRRAHGAGVAHIIVTGTNVAGSQTAVHLARGSPGALFATVGIHPHGARHWYPEVIATLKELARDPTTVAIGECGLDCDRAFSPRPVQRKCFTQQLELAAELGMPLFLHERNAHDDFLATLREHWPTLSRAVVHCFTGSARALERYLEIGAH
ncbi:TatD family hydrolase, partial [Myxococcota bacterium]